MSSRSSARAEGQIIWPGSLPYLPIWPKYSCLRLTICMPTISSAVVLLRLATKMRPSPRIAMAVGIMKPRPPWSAQKPMLSVYFSLKSVAVVILISVCAGAYSS